MFRKFYSLIFIFALVTYGKGYKPLIDSILSETLKGVLLEEPFSNDTSGYYPSSFNLFWVNPLCIDSIKTSVYSGPAQRCNSEIAFEKSIDSLTCAEIKIIRSVTMQKFGQMSENIVKTIHPKSGDYKATSSDFLNRNGGANSMNEIALRIFDHFRTILSDSLKSSTKGFVPFMIDIRYGKAEAWLRGLPNTAAISISTSFIDTLTTDSLNSAGIRYETQKNGETAKIFKEHKIVKNKVIVMSRRK